MSSGHCAELGVHQAPLPSDSLRKLYLAIGLCALFMAVEIIGGFWSNSLAIISDAVHLLSDIAGFFTSVIAIIVARRAASKSYSFGFQRAQTIGAFISIAFVWVLTVYLIMEAIERIKEPENINGKMMFIIAVFGTIINIVLAFALGHTHHGHGHNHGPTHSVGGNLPDDAESSSVANFTRKVDDINLRAAFIHVLGDLIQSIGVLIASALIWYNGDWRIADPICTLLFSVIVFGTTIVISKDILRILMEGTPKNIDTLAVSRDLSSYAGVERIHDLHIWSLSPGNIALTVHIVIKKEVDHQDRGRILAKLQELLCAKYDIHHPTIQIEEGESIHCSPPYCSPSDALK